MPKPKPMCIDCGAELTYSRKRRKWYCKDCLHAAYLTHLAQMEAQKRYRTSEKGKAATKKYEDSKKGKTARERYLKGPKYKARRKEYNERLKESLALARAAGVGRGERERYPEIIRQLELEEGGEE